MSAIRRLVARLKKWFLDPLPHDKFDEWGVPADQFLHEYHKRKNENADLPECIPCVVEYKGGCVYRLNGKCMLPEHKEDDK